MAPREPPVPIGATYSTGAKTLTVTFDRQLTPGFVDGANWTGRYSNKLHSGPLFPGMIVAGATVSAVMVAGLVNVGPDVTHYNPPPFDVQSSFGVPAAGFIDYPTVLIP